jgi:hypothetical protein
VLVVSDQNARLKGATRGHGWTGHVQDPCHRWVLHSPHKNHVNTPCPAAWHVRFRTSESRKRRDPRPRIAQRVVIDP